MDTTRSWKAILLGVLFGLLGAGILYLITRPPRGAQIQLKEPPTPAPLVIHVTGAVVDPGLYTLPVGARVQDALEAAGGSLATADLGTMNLAKPVEDGERIWVPYKIRSDSDPQPAPQAFSTPQANDQEKELPQNDQQLININTASSTELESLPGIGPDKAEKIISYRVTQGLFKSIEEIENVSGIGPATFNKIKALISISDHP